MARHKNRKMRRSMRENKHHVLFQRQFWEKDPYAVSLRNYFVYMIPICIHDRLHSIVHDIPVPPRDELVELWTIVNTEKPDYFYAYEACEYLARVSTFEPFSSMMRYQAQILKEARV